MGEGEKGNKKLLLTPNHRESWNMHCMIRSRMSRTFKCCPGKWFLVVKWPLTNRSNDAGVVHTLTRDVNKLF